MMTHQVLEAMRRDETTLIRMHEFSFKMWESSVIKMVGMFPKEWDMVTNFAFDLIDVESISIEEWDRLEGLDNWLHDTISGWSTFGY